MATISLHYIKGLHPMSNACTEEGLYRAGNWHDSFTGEAHETIEIQLLGHRESRTFTRRQDHNTQLYPELADVEIDGIACLSANGQHATGGIYTGTECARCPHSVQNRCRPEVVPYVRHVSAKDETIREMYFRGKSLPAWTEILLETASRERPWEVVIELKGRIVKVGEGKAFVAQVVSTREATKTELAAAEKLYAKTFTTLARIMADRDNAIAAPDEDDAPKALTAEVA